MAAMREARQVLRCRALRVSRFDVERSTASATPLPPPRHSVAMPRFRFALLERVEQRRQDARAARADRMAERHGAAVDVDARRVEAELCSTATACTENASFSSKDPPRRAASRLSQRRAARRRPASSARTSAPGRSSPVPTMRASGVEAERPRALRRHHDQRRRAVVDAGRVAGRHRAVRLERGLQRAERSTVVSAPDRLVAIDDDRRRPFAAESRPAGSRP